MGRIIRTSISMISLSVLLISFQNCSEQGLYFEDSIHSEQLSFFNYNFSEKTPFYHDIKIFEAGTEGNLRMFDLLGTVSLTDPDDTTPISWEIAIVADDGTSTVPAKGNILYDGTLVHVLGIVGDSSVNYTNLWIKITYDDVSYEYNTPLNLDN